MVATGVEQTVKSIFNFFGNTSSPRKDPAPDQIDDLGEMIDDLGEIIAAVKHPVQVWAEIDDRPAMAEVRRVRQIRPFR